MPISEDHSRALLRDPNIPTADLVVWADPARLVVWADPARLVVWADPARPRTKKRIATAAVGAFVLGVATMADAAPDAPRLAPPGCIFHTVVKGDTVWRIAGKAGITLDVVARLNPQIADLSKIEVGDQIATSCGVNEVQLAPAAHLVNVDKYLGERDAPNVASKKAILAALWKAGARGDQLITLAAITEGESVRRITAVGDVEIQTGDWGPSVGPFQVRTLKSQTGKGTTRDIHRAATLEGGARSAVELWNQSVERGKPGGQPWTAFLKSWHTPHMASYAAAAAEMGL